MHRSLQSCIPCTNHDPRERFVDSSLEDKPVQMWQTHLRVVGKVFDGIAMLFPDDRATEIEMSIREFFHSRII